MTRTAKIKLYECLIASCPNAELKGVTILYTSLNGHMYSYFTKDEFLALKLPQPEKETFLKKYRTKLVEQYGIVQKEFVVVPDSLLAKTHELQFYFQTSYNYVNKLKPKLPKKSKSKKMQEIKTS